MIEATSVTVGVTVGDMDEAAAWFGRLFGTGPDLEPVEGILEYEVRPGFWLQISEGKGGSGEAIIRIGVGDIEGAVDRLRDLGVDVGQTEVVEGVIAFCDFPDPWGNQFGLYQLL